MILVSLQNFFSTHYTTKQQVYSWKPERERVGMSKKMINDLILTHFSIIWPNTTVLRKTKTRKLNQPGGNCKFFIRSMKFNKKKNHNEANTLLIKKLALNLLVNLCRDPEKSIVIFIQSQLSNHLNLSDH